MHIYIPIRRKQRGKKESKKKQKDERRDYLSSSVKNYQITIASVEPAGMSPNLNHSWGKENSTSSSTAEINMRILIKELTYLNFCKELKALEQILQF